MSKRRFAVHLLGLAVEGDLEAVKTPKPPLLASSWSLSAAALAKHSRSRLAYWTAQKNSGIPGVSQCGLACEHSSGALVSVGVAECRTLHEQFLAAGRSPSDSAHTRWRADSCSSRHRHAPPAWSNGLHHHDFNLYHITQSTTTAAEWSSARAASC